MELKGNPLYLCYSILLTPELQKSIMIYHQNLVFNDLLIKNSVGFSLDFDEKNFKGNL